MHTAECTLEYSAFEYYKQQKRRGYMRIQEKKANSCCNTPEDANSTLHGRNETRRPEIRATDSMLENVGVGFA